MALTHQTRVQFPDGEWSVPPELRWQSGRLLTDRSLVRSQVVATRQFLPFFPQEFGPVCAEGWRGTMTPRTHGATAARRIPDPKVGGSNPSGFIPFCLFFFFFPRARASFLFFVSDLPETLPPELRWQSGRLLTDRSLVRSQVVATRQFLPFFPQEFGPVCAEGWRGTMTPRTHGATAARRIPDPKVGGSNPSGLIIFCVLRFALLGGRITHKGGPPCSTFISHFFAQVGYLPGRGVSLIKKGLRLVWSRIIAL